MTSRYEIAVFPGDGIGPEVIEPTLVLLDAVSDGFALDCRRYEAGAAHYERTGVSLPEAAMDAARKADAILLGAMGLPRVRYDNGTEIAPQLELREALDLYAGVRPIRTFPGLPLPLAAPEAASLDAVLVRESTEGLFYSRGRKDMDGDDVARDTLRVSRSTSERLFDFCFELAHHRQRLGHPGRVTCVDKANVLTSMAFFRRIFDERAKRHPELEADHCYVDAAGLRMVKAPWTFDVLVTENMFGDILSDVAAGLMGGMGMAPSADIGDGHAVFQPCHGSAPDIVGEGKANPIATFLSAAMMLDWLGMRHDDAPLRIASRRIENAIGAALAPGRLLPYELGGRHGTADLSAAVIGALDS